MTRDHKGIESRRTVTRRLDNFFSAWLDHLADGSARIWARVESTLRDSTAHKDDGAQSTADMQTVPPMRVPMQQQPQPVQQQQQKKEEEK